ncbi:hypothetical protein P7L74_22470 [Tistrella mobilis]|jgi:hypothetical protein|uniref:hypothetical protein n=1 Tax=Tistrella mobilis TaxID=171437 RepID=UPI0035569991
MTRRAKTAPFPEVAVAKSPMRIATLLVVGLVWIAACAWFAVQGLSGAIEDPAALLVFSALLAGIAGMLVWTVIDLVRRPGPVMVLAPDGLIAPFLGSDRPIPWADVQMRRSALGAWFMGIVLAVRIDPTIHTGRPGPARLFGSGGRRLDDGRVEVDIALPNIFAGGRERVIALIMQRHVPAALAAAGIAPGGSKR